MCPTTKDETIPGPTAAQDKLTEEERNRGVTMVDPQWGYKVLVEPSGLHLPSLFQHEACEDCRNNFELKSHDVVIATFPKCGTTWMQQVVLLLMKGSKAEVYPFKDSIWPEFSTSKTFMKTKMDLPAMSVDDLMNLPPPSEETDSGIRVWKSHSPVGHVGWKDGLEGAHQVGAKVIVVTRNPKDVAISKYHHSKKIPIFQFNGEWEHFAPIFLKGKTVHGSFWDWNRDWWIAKEKYPKTILFVHYEDMKENLKKEITRVAEFLNLDRTDEELEKVTQRCTFDSMKGEAKARDDVANKVNFFRSGKKGGWVDTMSTETVAEFEAITEAMYSQCGLRFKE